MKFEEIKQLMGIKRNGMKFTDKDYLISNNLPNNLVEYEVQKAKRIQELEKTFLLESNTSFELVNRFVHGELKNWDICALKEELDIHKGNKNKRRLGKLGLMCDLNQEYEDLTGTRYPCYDQYVNHIWVVTSKLEKEIGSRKRKKFERRFSKQGNQSFELWNRIKNGEMESMNNEALFKLYGDYEDRVVRIDLLTEAYCKLIGDKKGRYRTPDYIKHLNYSNAVFAELDLEMIFRDEESKGEFKNENK